MPVVKDLLDSLKVIEAVHRKKNDDYASANNPLSNFDVQEYISSLFTNPRDRVFATMIAVKLARLSTLLNKEGEPNNESIEDSFIDTATYTLLWKADYVARSNNKRKNPEKQSKRKKSNSTTRGIGATTEGIAESRQQETNSSQNQQN